MRRKLMTLMTPKTSQPAIAGDSDIQGALSSAPVWLQYLIGAYPDAWINEMTFFVLEDQFSNFAPEVMMDAVRLYVRHNDRFPKSGQLLTVVQKIAQLSDWETFTENMTSLGYELHQDDGEEASFVHRHTGKLAIIFH